MSLACTSAAYHARFLRELVAQDIFRSKQQKAWEDGHSRCMFHALRHMADDAADDFLPNSNASRIDTVAGVCVFDIR
jgi:hypothetical protein